MTSIMKTSPDGYLLRLLVMLVHVLLVSGVHERKTLYKHKHDTTWVGRQTIPNPLTGRSVHADHTHNITKQDFSHILPTTWQGFCKVEFKTIGGSNFTTRHAFEVSCSLGKGDSWSLLDYRDWIASFKRTFYRYIPNNEELAFAFLLQCSDSSAEISLPFPVKAFHLWYVSIDNCTITDQLLEYNIQHSEIPDTLGVLQITNSVITLDTEQFFMKTKNYLNTSRDFYCGSESLEKFVLRNNSKIFTKPKLPDINLAAIKSMDAPKAIKSGQQHDNMSKSHTPRHEPKNELEMNDIFAKFTQDHLKVIYRCTHKKLQYLEETYQKTMSRHHSHFMLENARYPVLRYFNMSRSGIVNMGPHMLDWRRYFPKMKYMDLSYNHIKYFSSLTDNGMSTDSGGVLDLRHNNITSLTPDDLEALRLHSRTVFVDIRNNPMVCDCKLKTVVGLLHNKTYQAKLDRRYGYLQKLTCTSPARHKGKVLSSLEKEFCEFLEYILLSTPLVIVSSLSVMSLALFIVIVRYRKEIVILAFTRLHISLPCRKVYKNTNKKYDAFIAYSEQDSYWVFNTLLPRLEDTQENNGPGLKLCIHHRDFPIGGAITDNILDKVKESRHTVLILSNNFLRSHWCKYEFRAAFTQSLMEKKQHLIMVLQEELDKTLIEKTLQRCLKTFTYVKADDKLFWDKLIYALSDREKHENSSSKYSCKYVTSPSQSSLITPNGNSFHSLTTQNAVMSDSFATPNENLAQKTPKSKGHISKNRRSLTTSVSGRLPIRSTSQKVNLSTTFSTPNVNPFRRLTNPNGILVTRDINSIENGRPSDVSIISSPSLVGQLSSLSNKSDITMDTVTEYGPTSDASIASDTSMDTESNSGPDYVSNITNENIGSLYASVNKNKHTNKNNNIEDDAIDQCYDMEMERELDINSNTSIIDLSDIIGYYSLNESDENDMYSFKESVITLDDTEPYLGSVSSNDILDSFTRDISLSSNDVDYRITLEDTDLNDNEKCDSLVDTMSPWIESWFPGNADSDTQNSLELGSRNNIHTGSNHYDDNNN